MRRLALCATAALLALTTASAAADPAYVDSTHVIPHFGVWTVFKPRTTAVFDGLLGYRRQDRHHTLLGHLRIHCQWPLDDFHDARTGVWCWLRNSRATEYTMVWGGLFDGGAGSLHGGTEFAKCPYILEEHRHAADKKLVTTICRRKDTAHQVRNMSIFVRFVDQNYPAQGFVCVVRSPVIAKIPKGVWRFINANRLPGRGGPPRHQDHARCWAPAEGDLGGGPG